MAFKISLGRLPSKKQTAAFTKAEEKALHDYVERVKPKDKEDFRKTRNRSYLSLYFKNLGDAQNAIDALQHETQFRLKEAQAPKDQEALKQMQLDRKVVIRDTLFSGKYEWRVVFHNQVHWYSKGRSSKSKKITVKDFNDTVEWLHDIMKGRDDSNNFGAYDYRLNDTNSVILLNDPDIVVMLNLVFGDKIKRVEQAVLTNNNNNNQGNLFDESGNVSQAS